MFYKSMTDYLPKKQSMENYAINKKEWLQINWTFSCEVGWLWSLSLQKTEHGAAFWSCVWQKRSFKVMFELCFTQMQLHLAVWAAFLSNAAPPVPKPRLKSFKPRLWGIFKKKKKKGLNLELRLLNLKSNHVY